MKILAVADEEAKYLYDFYQPGRLAEYDLILSCGDLRKGYLEFLVTMARCPVVYVCGNHDDAYDEAPPEGCICAEDRIVTVNGIRILGLGGSYRYRDGNHMFTEKQMRTRVRKLFLPLHINHGFDILLTHAPARHINDMDNLTHRGFECFSELLDRYEPGYFVHGHIHRNYGMHIPRMTERGKTTIINAYEYYPFDYK